MKRKGLDNFKKWREQAQKEGIIKTSYPPLKKNGDLAELIGAILGDGHIEKFPRCEALYLTFHANDVELIERYTNIVERIFNKKPHVAKQKTQASVRIRLYEKEISKRLNIPTGARAKYNVRIPLWVMKKRQYIIRYLRGLYEAEGSLCFHRGTYTHKMIFTNANDSLLRVVFRLLKKLGFHPHCSYRKVQVSKKDEVQKLANLLQFRHY